MNILAHLEFLETSSIMGGMILLFREFDMEKFKIGVEGMDRA